MGDEINAKVYSTITMGRVLIVTHITNMHKSSEQEIDFTRLAN